MSEAPKIGTDVSTPNGVGKVLRVSDMNHYAHVEVDGQAFEVMFEDIDELPGIPGSQPVAAAKNFEAAKTDMFFDIAKDMAEIDGKSEKHKDKWQGEPAATKTEPQPGHEFKFEGNPDAIKEAIKGMQQQQDNKGEQSPEQEQSMPEKPAAKKPVANKSTAPAGSIDGLFQGILDNMNDRVDEHIDAKVDKELAELREMAKAKQTLEVKVGDKINKVEGKRHKQLEQLITYCALRMNTLMVGMAGTGKTHAAEQAAEAQGLPFFTMSVGAQTSKTDIIGYMAAGGQYIGTHFRQAYEHGGVFLMDEIDAGNANVLIQVNAALSNGLAAFPDAMIKKHKDFIFIASANTYGTGANRQYVGRNQLDAATLDRFAILDWIIDDELERQLSVGRHQTAWYLAVQAARDYVMQHSIRALITPRATQKGSLLLEAGVHLEQVIPSVLLGSVPQDKQPEVSRVAMQVYNNHKQDDTSQQMKV